MTELLPRARDLARAAARAGIGFNIDAEEAERLELSLDVIEALLDDAELAGWDGFGVVVQAYGRRAGAVIDWLDALARRLDRRIMVRLVKGAYWDAEIKAAQEQGLPDFPVFTRKPSTDASYLANARQLLDARERIYPQFATHNAHTVAAVLELAGDRRGLRVPAAARHGRGAARDRARARRGRAAGSMRRSGRTGICWPTWCGGCWRTGRIRPSSTRSSTSGWRPEEVAADPLAAVEAFGDAVANPGIRRPAALFAPRRNARGWNVNEPASIAALAAEREAWRHAPLERRRRCWPRVRARAAEPRQVVNPARPARRGRRGGEATAARCGGGAGGGGRRVRRLVGGAGGGAGGGAAAGGGPLRGERGGADGARDARGGQDAGGRDLGGARGGRFPALLCRRGGGGDRARRAGSCVCISPWNFPLAIFTGQVAACLGAGNAVIAKPAEQTPLIAARAVGADARGGGAGGGAAAAARRRADGRRAADGGAGDRRGVLHRLDRGGAGDPPGAGRERRRRTRC